MIQDDNRLKRIIQNNGDTINEYAYTLYNGDGVAKDVKEAYRIFRIAADQGDTVAMFWLGAICENEDEFRSPKEGFEWFFKAAKMGNIAAQYQIGYHYLHGVYVEQDYFQAFKWFMISAVRGYPHSQNSIGTMYLRGQVKVGEWIDKNHHSDNEIKIDQEKCQRFGYRWLMKSAKQNHPSGLYNLAGMYLYGVYVDKDEELAVSMYRIANEIGGTGMRALDMLNKLGTEIRVQQTDYERLDHLFEDINETDMSDNVPADMLNYIIGTQKLAFPEMTKNDELQVMSAVTDEYKREQSRERYYLLLV